MKRIFFVLLILISLSAVTNLCFASKTIIIDFNHAKLPKSNGNKGKIFIGKILNLRKSQEKDSETINELYKNKNFVGTLAGSFGGLYRLISYKEKSIDNLIRGLVKNALEFSGYDVAESEPDGSAPVINIEIEDFNIQGYLGYLIYIKLNFILLDKNNELLLKSTIDSNIGFFIWKSLAPMYNTLHILLNEVLFGLVTIIETDQFTTAFNELKKIDFQESTIINSKIKEIPDNIQDNINFLNLRGNEINSISNLENKTELFFLNLKGNKIKKIENIGDSKLLKGINLRNNKLTEIENLDNQKELRYIMIGLNDLKNISGFDNLKKLLWVCFNDNDSIKKLTDIDKLSHLLFLDLSDCDLLKKIENLDNFNNLISLNLSSSDLIKIEGLENLTELRELYLFENDFRKIENLDNLINLEVLDLSDNNIKKLDNLSNLKNLKELKIIGSYTTRPASNKISKIENLDELKNLEYLNLSCNNITKIENLDNLKKLKRLCLAGNKLEKIENLENLDSLKSIIFVDGFIETAIYMKPPKKITNKTYNFLKNNNVLIDEKFYIDEYIKEYKIKIIEE